jgi:hypothetical protein
LRHADRRKPAGENIRRTDPIYSIHRSKIFRFGAVAGLHPPSSHAGQKFPARFVLASASFTD